jgi:glycosyltransferase involved in cell wall biosynthesis
VTAPPTFSVVVPTFGRPAHLAEALASVLAQTVTDLECVVVDDASEAAPALPDDPRLRLVRRDRNGGPAAARNTGIANARARYLAFLDDDDVWVPERLALALDAHARAPVTVCWQATLGHETVAPTGRRLDGPVADVLFDGMVPHLGATTIERVVAPPFDERYETSEDVEWWFRVAQQHPVATTPRVGLLYRPHTAPRPRTGHRNRVRDGRMFLEEHREWFDAHPRAKAFRLKRLGLAALRANDRRVALRCFAGSLRLDPQPRTAWHALRSIAPARGASDG